MKLDQTIREFSDGTGTAPTVSPLAVTGKALATVCLAALPAAVLAGLPLREALGITPQRLWIYVHLLLFVFWLGADLGVFLCGRAATRPALSPEQRWRTVGLMRSIDLAPRLAAGLMLTVGGVLTEFVGIEHPWWQMTGIVLLGPIWSTLILLSFFAGTSGAGRAATTLDGVTRWMLVFVVPLSVAWSWFSGRLEPAPYVAVKLLLFAWLMLLGSVMRSRWRPILDAYARTPAGATGAIEAHSVGSMARNWPLMVVAWLSLVLAAWLGVAKPGAREPVETRQAARAAIIDPLLLPRP